jgi:hypothetical protein
MGTLYNKHVMLVMYQNFTKSKIIAITTIPIFKIPDKHTYTHS